jgi:hypothetical protein
MRAACDISTLRGRGFATGLDGLDDDELLAILRRSTVEFAQFFAAGRLPGLLGGVPFASTVQIWG